MLKTFLSEAILKFVTGHFTGIVKALTIHREFTRVEMRDVIGAALRIMALTMPFVSFPTWLSIAVISLLALSFLVRIAEVVITLFLMRRPARTAATQAHVLEIESEAVA